MSNREAVQDVASGMDVMNKNERFDSVLTPDVKYGVKIFQIGIRRPEVDTLYETINVVATTVEEAIAYVRTVTAMPLIFVELLATETSPLWIKLRANVSNVQHKSK